MTRNGFLEKHLAVLVTAIASFAAVLVSATQIWVAHTNNEKEFQLSKIQTARAIILQAGLQLGARKNDEIDLDTRLAGIASLRLLTTEKPPIEYYEAAVDLLETYVRLNLSTRKVDSLGVELNRGNTRPVDIIAAIVALQKIQKATDKKIRVKLIGQDFSRMNLGHVNLEGFDLSYSNFQHAMLGPNLRHTNLNFADLSYAAIWNADMSYASFHKAILKQTKLQNVKLTGTNIEQAAKKNTAIFTVSGLTQNQSSLFSNYKEYKCETR